MTIRRTHQPGRRRRSLLGAGLAVAVLGSACAGGGAGRAAPPLILPVNAQPSLIVAADGAPITTLQAENRSTVPLSAIPRLMQNAVIAIEDERYWQHNGVDPKAIVRAAKENAAAGATTQGGSTITQQYVKNVLLTPEKTLSRKIEEASLAIQLERNYSKELILEQYLNTVYLGGRAFGVDAAARTYFDKGIEDVTVAEAALIAGLIQAPSQYDPQRNPDTARKRRDEVLKRMRAQSYISEAQHEEALATPVVVSEPKPPPEAVRYPAAHFVDEVKKWFLDNEAFGPSREDRTRLLLEGGLRIETTIDLGLQRLAEESVAAVLPRPGSDPDAALVALEPDTGFVRAMYGGYDYFGDHPYAKVNLATRPQQPGSAFKTIALAEALENGIGLEDRYPSPKQEYYGPSKTGGPPWSPKGGPGGSQRLTDCLVHSWNTCFTNLIFDERVGKDGTTEMARKLGIRSPITPQWAMVLGSEGTTPLDMASAYGTIDNLGLHVPPVLVLRVVRPDGTVLHGHQHTERRAMSATSAAELTRAMRGVIEDPGGTAHRTAQLGRPAAGKTGTAQDNKDAWFCGYTPELVTVVSMGFADKRGRNTRPSMGRVFGGTKPAQIWARFMNGALDGTPPREFPAPPENDPTIVATTTTTPPAALTPVTAPTRVEVPDVTGKDIFTAQGILRRAGFRLERIITTDDGRGAGRVQAQSPPAGSRVVSGLTVILETNPGEPPPSAPVPDVRGLSRDEAVRRLESGRWRVTVVEADPPSTTLRPDGAPYGPSQVWFISPSPGTVSPDGRVTVRVSGGDYEPPTTTAPPTTTTTTTNVTTTTEG